MHEVKADIVSRLQREVLQLQGYKPSGSISRTVPMGPMAAHFPGGQFPVGHTHEFVISDPESRAATLGFVHAIGSSLLGSDKIGVWISHHATVFPPALINYGVSPDQLLFIHTRNERETLWVTEESLRCEGLALVATEISRFDFTASRRLQLAVAKSKVTGFILRSFRYLSTSASVSRWQVHAIPGTDVSTHLPGIHFPRWQVSLLKVRNGRPGTWQVSWRQLQFQFEESPALILPAGQRKVI